MLEGKGYFKGSSILVSGMAGSGKSTVAADFVDATCASGHRCIYFAMEESPRQIIRNMHSVGIELQKWVDKKLLRFSARRPSLFGLETHLATMYRDVTDFDPTAVAIDPMSALLNAGSTGDVHSMILRLVDFLKARGVTALFTNLGVSSENVTTEIQISSLMDTWLLLYNRESNGEHNRQLYLLKSRGMAHSNQVREFILSSDGIKLRQAYVGPEGVLTGSARLSQEAKDKAAVLVREQDMERRNRELERKRREITAQIEILQAQLASDEAEAALLNREGAAREDQLDADRVAMGVSRQTGATPA
jgi:circadian clock protein KaiC